MHRQGVSSKGNMVRGELEGGQEEANSHEPLKGLQTSFLRTLESY